MARTGVPTPVLFYCLFSTTTHRCSCETYIGFPFYLWKTVHIISIMGTAKLGDIYRFSILPLEIDGCYPLLSQVPKIRHLRTRQDDA